MKISYFSKNKFEIYQAPNLIEQFFLSKNFKKIDLNKINKSIDKNIFTKLFNRFVYYYEFFKKVKFLFKSPKKNKIIIFDDIGNEISFILKKENFFLINPRINSMKEIFLNYKILIFILFNIYKRSLKINYLIALINEIDPKIVITFIDNSQDFHKLSKYFDKKKDFVAVQNANRGDYSFLKEKQKKNVHIQKLFCLGEFDVEFFKRNLINNNPIVLGSLKNSIFFNKYKKEINEKILFDICLIGKNIVKKGNTDLTYENLILPESMILLNNLKKYLLNTKKSLVICCKNYGFKLEAEKYFYKKFFENINISISTNAENISDDNYFNSYKNLIKSEVIIGLPSTLLREAFFYKKKILCFDYSNLDNHPFKNISLCNKNDYQSFDQKLNLLFKINYEDYLKELNYPNNYVIGKMDTINEIKSFLKIN